MSYVSAHRLTSAHVTLDFHLEQIEVVFARHLNKTREGSKMQNLRWLPLKNTSKANASNYSMQKKNQPGCGMFEMESESSALQKISLALRKTYMLSHIYDRSTFINISVESTIFTLTKINSIAMQMHNIFLLPWPVIIWHVLCAENQWQTDKRKAVLSNAPHTIYGMCSKQPPLRKLYHPCTWNT